LRWVVVRGSIWPASEVAGAGKDKSYYIFAWRGSSGRFGSRWKANMKVLGCEKAKWIEVV
jgi:hypothetical protein